MAASRREIGAARANLRRYRGGLTLLCETTSGPNHGRRDAGLGYCVSGIWNYIEFGLLPNLVEIPRIHERRHDIITAMHDHPWDVAQSVRLSDQLAVIGEKAAIDEIVTFDR